MSKPIDVRNMNIIDLEHYFVSQVYKEDLLGILISKGQIKSRVDKIAEDISKDYDKVDNLFALCVLDGAMRFYNDLFFNERMNLPFQIGTCRTSSYSGTESTGDVKIASFNFNRLAGKKVIVVEDIFDTGRTLTALTKQIEEYKPQSIEIACLLDKPERRLSGVDIKPKYVGFIIPDNFVVGYGLDFNDQYRGLQHLGVLKEEVYKKK